MTDQDWVVVARIIRPQGRKGEVLASILTDFPEKFAERRQLFLLETPPREVQLEHHWLHKDRIVFKFAGVDSISQAEALRGLALAIPRSERAGIEEDSVYISDLIGCELIDQRSAQPIGTIADVDRESSAIALLVVSSGQSAEILVPFVKAWLRRVDLPAKRIVMELPDGLLDLNS